LGKGNVASCHEQQSTEEWFQEHGYRWLHGDDDEDRRRRAEELFNSLLNSITLALGNYLRDGDDELSTGIQNVDGQWVKVWASRSMPFPVCGRPYLNFTWFLPNSDRQVRAGMLVTEFLSEKDAWQSYFLGLGPRPYTLDRFAPIECRWTYVEVWL